MTSMRSEQEMMDLILRVAREDERIRAVYMGGSRNDPNAPRDFYQDYDIVYIVRDITSFTSDHSWIDVFGPRLMLQMPEAMREPEGKGNFNYLMLFLDGNRIDLRLFPLEKPELIEDDSLNSALLDKDGILPDFQKPDDSSYWVSRPSELYYASCCNNFWWCMQNVAKGISRDERPYAMEMFDGVVRAELNDMVSWYIGCEHGFSVSPGKMGKYFKRFLPEDLYHQYLATYSNSEPENLWRAVFTACDLFGRLASQVGGQLGYRYNRQDEEHMRGYLRWAQAHPVDEMKMEGKKNEIQMV
ncbi:MAG: aminoglycoside 6-adenylyltransferase [Clostridia bacterium]